MRRCGVVVIVGLLLGAVTPMHAQNVRCDGTLLELAVVEELRAHRVVDHREARLDRPVGRVGVVRAVEVGDRVLEPAERLEAVAAVDEEAVVDAVGALARRVQARLRLDRLVEQRDRVVVLPALDAREREVVLHERGGSEEAERIHQRAEE